MRKTRHIVPVSMCVVSAFMLAGCDQADTNATQIKPASQQAPAVDQSKTADSTLQAENLEKPADSAVAVNAIDPAASVDPVAAMLSDKPTGASASELSAARATPQVQPPNPAISTVMYVKADPAEVDLGDIPTNDSKAGKVKLVNTADTPMTITAARASCGCTALKFQPNTVLGPNQTIEVDVQMTGGPRPGPLHGKTVTFTVQDHPDIVVNLKANAVSFVVANPTALDPDSDQKLVLSSIDGQAFRIMSTQPAVVDLGDREPKTEHEVAVDWTKYREIGVNRQLIVYLDHPKCQNVFVQVNFKPEEIADQNRKMQQQQMADKKAIMERDQPQPQPVTPPDPDTVLADMIKQGRNAEVLAKLQSGLDVNYRNAGGVPLLSMAAEAGNADLLRALLAIEKVDLGATDNNGRTPLMYAASSRSVETVQTLLDKGADPRTRDSLGATALWWAAMRGEAAVVKELIDAGSDVEIVGTITGWTPLIVAAGFGDPGSIEPLLDAHANIEAQDMIEGATPLIYAAMTGKVDAIKVLLKRGANIENSDRNGNTALLACAKASGGEAEKLRVLIEAGANIHAKDNRGYNALQLARKRTDIRAGEVIAVLEPLLGPETPAADSGAQPAAAAHAGHDHAPGEAHDHEGTPN